MGVASVRGPYTEIRSSLPFPRCTPVAAWSRIPAQFHHPDWINSECSQAEASKTRSPRS